MPKEFVLATAIGSIAFILYRAWKMPLPEPVTAPMLPGTAARHPTRSRGIGALRPASGLSTMYNYTVPTQQVFSIWSRR